MSRMYGQRDCKSTGYESNVWDLESTYRVPTVHQVVIVVVKMVLEPSHLVSTVLTSRLGISRT